jgi:hypothetical protein
MSVTTFEGIVEQGKIRLASDVQLPDNTRVYIIVPDIELKEPGLTLHSPRLAHPERASEFEMEVVEQ